jgi:DNA-directed RNA polymerase specialized sigma24 family protein
MSPYENQVAAPPRQNWFATTHWTVVLAAGDRGAPQAAEALEKLCRLYWYPLYAYVRRKGYNVHDAEDLTQAFFAHFLDKNYLARASQQRGRFRSFLLTSMQNFLAHEWERARAAKRGGGRTLLSWDEISGESRYALEPASDLSPDNIFEQRCAAMLFQKALSELQREMAAAGNSEQFERLKRFLSAKAQADDYAEAASGLGMTPGAVGVAVHRLRQRYGELVREEIAHTVATPAEVEEEMRYLIKLVSR